MIREPLAGTFEDLVKIVELNLDAYVRLFIRPDIEPYWTVSATHRFDDPENDFGVLYAGDSLATAFAESVIHDNARFEPKSRKFQVSVHDFSREVTTFTSPSGAPLFVADFSGDGLKGLGLNADICAGEDYVSAQAWSKAIHDALPTLAGIRYPSRQYPGHACIALFERSRVALSSHRPMTAKERIDLCRHFNVALV